MAAFKGFSVNKHISVSNTTVEDAHTSAMKEFWKMHYWEVCTNWCKQDNFHKSNKSKGTGWRHKLNIQAQWVNSITLLSPLFRVSSWRLSSS